MKKTAASRPSKKQARFLIYALARTGSNNLARMLNTHPNIRCDIEPFLRETFLSSGYPMTQEGIKALIEQLWEKETADRVCGFKHVWAVTGWPFEENPGMNDYVLTGLVGRVVLLERRNILRRIVSQALSEQTNLWYADTPEDRRRHTDFKFRDLDIANLRYYLVRERDAIESSHKMLERSSIAAKIVTYESLYETDAAQRVTTLKDVLSFLLSREATDEDLNPVMLKHLLDSSEKLNSSEVYRAVPNIDEVNERLGSDDTGWIFEPSRPTGVL